MLSRSEFTPGPFYSRFFNGEEIKKKRMSSLKVFTGGKSLNYDKDSTHVESVKVITNKCFVIDGADPDCPRVSIRYPAPFTVRLFMDKMMQSVTCFVFFFPTPARNVSIGLSNVPGDWASTSWFGTTIYDPSPRIVYPVWRFSHFLIFIFSSLCRDLPPTK
ncbi:MAG TPA: hypothetical protein V6C97_32775 [Oculatellaceae cyanobacterium]